jgi:hypothetical protein
LSTLAVNLLIDLILRISSNQFEIDCPIDSNGDGVGAGSDTGCTGADTSCLGDAGADSLPPIYVYMNY